MARVNSYERDSVFYRQHGLTEGLWHRMTDKGFYRCEEPIDRNLPGPAFETQLLGRLQREDICPVCLRRDRDRPPSTPYFAPYAAKPWDQEEDETIKCHWRKEGVDGLYLRLPHRQKAVLQRHAKVLGVRK